MLSLLFRLCKKVATNAEKLQNQLMRVTYFSAILATFISAQNSKESSLMFKLTSSNNIDIGCTVSLCWQLIQIWRPHNSCLWTYVQYIKELTMNKKSVHKTCYGQQKEWIINCINFVNHELLFDIFLIPLDKHLFSIRNRLLCLLAYRCSGTISEVFTM